MAKIGDMPAGGGGLVAGGRLQPGAGADQVQPLGGLLPGAAHGPLITCRAHRQALPEAAVLSSCQYPAACLGQIHGSRLGQRRHQRLRQRARLAKGQHVTLVGCVQLAPRQGQLVIPHLGQPLPATGYCSAERRGQGWAQRSPQIKVDGHRGGDLHQAARGNGERNGVGCGWQIHQLTSISGCSGPWATMGRYCRARNTALPTNTAASSASGQTGSSLSAVPGCSQTYMKPFHSVGLTTSPT
ncbi:hypothetical protein D3C80_1239810 [compost metagenome]